MLILYKFLRIVGYIFSFRTFFSHKTCHIGKRSENKIAVAYINEMGGMPLLSLDKFAAEIWAWCSFTHG